MTRRYPNPTDTRLLCGVDEAGRGPLAGAVFAAAVVLDPKRPRINNLHDSKLLDAGTREKLSARIKERALARSFERFRATDWKGQTTRARELAAFAAREAWWLDDYALFRALHARERSSA